MKISFNELRAIKHQLPTGSVKRIATQIGVDEQTVRNYFGASKFAEGDVTGNHIQPGPDGGIVHLSRTDILELAKGIIEESKTVV
ncbi:MAG: DNA-binding protein [Saprospirales bacterium]|nr:MAG: DNA-binding protein [Saprospirales bacterium]